LVHRQRQGRARGDCCACRGSDRRSWSRRRTPPGGQCSAIAASTIGCGTPPRDNVRSRPVPHRRCIPQSHWGSVR
jgi:hypothetical protein